MSNVWLSNIFLNQAQLTRIISLQVQMTLVNIFYLGAVKNGDILSIYLNKITSM